MNADLIFDNGTVHTVSATGRLAGAVAITAGRITAVGESRDVAALRGPSTRVIDMQGGMLLPGFQDAHAHPAQSGHGRTQCSLTEIVGREATCQAIAAYATANPDREWVLGSGWSMGDFPGGLPTREELDALVPDRPAALINRDYHGMWVNSRALEVMGVTDSTPDPDGGRIERDALGPRLGDAAGAGSAARVRRDPRGHRGRPGDRHPHCAGLLLQPRDHRLGRRGRAPRRPGRVHAAGPVGRAEDARARDARLGAGRGSGPAPEPDRAPRGRRGRAARLRRGEVLPRRRVRELHGSHARPVPGLERQPDHQPRARSVRPGRAHRGGHGV